MKRYFFFLVFAPIVGFSQSDIVKRCIPMIAAQQFVDVDRLLDSILLKHPNEPDAWMMKGNSILNRHLLGLTKVPLITNQDEDVLSIDANGLNNPPQVPEKRVMDSVERCWAKTLAADSSREDMYMGFCTVYGMSLQTDKLLSCLPMLKKKSRKGDQLAYLMEDYARLLRERGKVADAHKVFAVIANLYPHASGIWSDWAGEYLLSADLKGAVEKADKALLCRSIDETTRENLTDVYLYAQQPEKAVKAITLYQKSDSTYTYAPLYRALYGFAIGDTLWKKQMTKLVAEKWYQSDTNEIVQVCKFLSSSIYTGGNYDITMAMLSAPLNSFCSWAVIHRAKNDFPDSANVQLIAAEFYLNGKNYAYANSIFKKAQTLKMDSVNRSDMNMVYAYSSYRADDKPTATLLFNSIAGDDNLFKRQAALYFLGKMSLPNTFLLKKLVTEKQKTKYFYLGQLLLDKVK